MSKLPQLLRRRRAVVAVAAVALAVAAAAHVVFWYAPRLRPAAPAGRARALLAGEGFAVALWLPFPHQTLPALEGELFADAPGAAAALFRLAGAAPPRLPSFGPLALPPATEVAVAWRDDDAALAAADVYPVFAAFARLAGALAGNPWLGGGDALRDGRRFAVAWEDGWWTVTPAGERRPADATGAEPVAPALARVRWRRDGEALPPGDYTLAQTGAAAGGGLVLSSGLAAMPAVADVAPGDLALLRWDGAAGRALLVLAAGGEDGRGLDLPRAVGVHRAGGRRFDLPGEELLAITGRDPHRAAVGDRVVESFHRDGLAAGSEAAARLDVLAGVDRLLWLDVARASREVGRIAAALGAIPLLPRREVAPWEDAAVVLAALDGAGWRSVALAVEGGAARLELRR